MRAGSRSGADAVTRKIYVMYMWSSDTWREGVQLFDVRCVACIKNREV